jgi:cysteine desulfurase
MGAMKRIYFDNAATTPLAPEVLEVMMPYLTEKFGNPSSIYSYGRETRLAIESARKTVARLLNAHPAEIFFTSGGTESSNTAIRQAVKDLGCTHIITSPAEHHATLHTVDDLQQRGEARVSYVSLLPDGHVDLNSLQKLVAGSEGKCLVTLMHANNEIGNITALKDVGDICSRYNAVFHSDTVQTIGHYPLDLHKTPVHFISGSAHKFHGPKGIGILYVSDHVRIKPLLQGGGQERNMRAGTENVYGIVGFARALELAMQSYEQDSRYILSLKMYMAEKLQEHISGVHFNGDAFGSSLYTVLNAALPRTEKSEMILFNLDIQHICASGGSACTSGADIGSHVIRAIPKETDQVAVRFSFSKYNSKEEIDLVVEKIKQMI